jgi:hypothetical protein
LGQERPAGGFVVLKQGGIGLYGGRAEWKIGDLAKGFSGRRRHGEIPVRSPDDGDSDPEAPLLSRTGIGAMAIDPVATRRGLTQAIDIRIKKRTWEKLAGGQKVIAVAAVLDVLLVFQMSG